jgi:Domain of unknown function (DUF6316)
MVRNLGRFAASNTYKRGNNMATSNRTGEQGSVPGRSHRFLEKAGYWYYQTREGVDIGPFDSQKEAEVGATDFINFINASAPQASTILRNYRAA